MILLAGSTELASFFVDISSYFAIIIHFPPLPPIITPWSMAFPPTFATESENGLHLSNSNSLDCIRFAPSLQPKSNH